MPERRSEVVGDSISAGAGVEGTTNCSNIDSYTNNYQAYGSVAARALNADVVTIAYSEIGVSRSCSVEQAVDSAQERFALAYRWRAANTTCLSLVVQQPIVSVDPASGDFTATTQTQMVEDVERSAVAAPFLPPTERTKAGRLAGKCSRTCGRGCSLTTQQASSR